MTSLTTRSPFLKRESGYHDAAKKKMAELLQAKFNSDHHSAWIEYPIVKGIGHTVLDEYIGEELISAQCVPQPYNDRQVPTYETCKSLGLTVVAVVDIAVPRKGLISEIWEITHSHPLTSEKVNTIDDALGRGYDQFHEIYEISTSWILGQDVDTLTLKGAYENAIHWSGYKSECTSKTCHVGCERIRQVEKERIEEWQRRPDYKRNSLSNFFGFKAKQRPSSSEAPAEEEVRAASAASSNTIP